MKANDPFNRRQVLAAGTAATTFTIVPRHVLGGAGYVAPSSKLNIAGIGVGGMGTGDVKSVSGENIVALCDVDQNALD
ncbi:MAG: gfo/Idh/MocA family oxidoreductase, partial [Isosphaeraceae bacterium]